MGITIPVKMPITQWFVPDVGVVKSRSKWGSQELSSIEQSGYLPFSARPLRWFSFQNLYL